MSIVEIKEKIKLDAYQTALLLVCKGHKVIQKYDIEDYKFTDEDSVLNDFRELVKTYCIITYIDNPGCIDIRHINIALMDVINVVKPDAIISILKYCCDRSRNSALYYNELLFYKLFGELQSLTMRQNCEEIYDLDETLIKKD